MSWTEKGKPTPLDDRPIEGLYFLDGDQVARVVKRDWTKGYKYPLVVFPSGEERSLWESSDPDRLAVVHLFGEMDLALKSSRDEAFEAASDIAEQCGYLVRKVGEDQLEAWGHDIDEHLLITYDEETHRMANIEVIKDLEPPPPPPLLDEESRERLPELYSTEEQGLDALAQVKFFTPDSNWTWYASEFDGEDLFFGLVSGFEVELGYFSLSELGAARGPIGLPIERDRYFEPRTLRELKALHERGEID